MKLPKWRAGRNMYLPIFLSLTVSVVVTILVVSTILYVNFEKEASMQIYLANMKSLEQVSREVNSLANSARTVSSQIFQDVNVAKLLYYSDPDVYDLGPALRQLSNYRFSIPSIASIYVYNSITGTLYIEGGSMGTIEKKDDGFTDLEVIRMIDHFHDYSPFNPTPRVYVDDNGVTKHYYTFLMYNLLTGEKLNGAVAINISAEWIQGIIHDDSDRASGETFIMDGNGRVVSHDLQYPMLADLSGHPHIRQILSNDSISDYFVTDVNGEKALVAYTKPDILGWRYVRIIPWKTMFEKIDGMRDTTIWVSLGILVLGIGASFLVTGRLSRPIGRMMNNLEALEREHQKNIILLRQELLRDLALGRIVGTAEDLEARSKACELSIGLHTPVIAVLFRIDGYHSFIGQNDLADRNLLRFAVGNAASELLEACGQNEAVDLGADMVLVVLTWPEPVPPEAEVVLRAQLAKLRDEISHYFQVSLSSAYTVLPLERIEQLPKLVAQLQEASLYRMFAGHGCILDANEVLQSRNKQYTYPLHREKTMLELMMSGRTEEAQGICCAILAETDGFPVMASSMTIAHMAFSLNEAVHLISKNGSHNGEEGAGTPQIMPREAETLEEVTMQFRQFFNTVATWLEERKSEKQGALISRIQDMINREYGNPTLSVDSIAGSLGLSTPHMSRIYKQHTLHTVLEDIILMRMRKARELLLTTECSVNEISEQVGFSNGTYFYKAFKQSNGVTPTEYRKNYRFMSTENQRNFELYSKS